MSDTDNLNLAVEGGLHVGVRQEVPFGPVRVGSDVAADIVLRDDGIEPFHLVIEHDGERIRLEALADGVDIEGVGVLSQGESCHLELPVVTSLGAARLRWFVPAVPAVDPPMPQTSRLLRLLHGRSDWVVGVVAILCAGFVVSNQVADAAFSNRDARPVEQGDSAHPKVAGLPDSVTGSGAAAAPKAATSPDSAIGVVRAQISKAGLLNVSVTPGGAGVVMATGTIEPAAAGSWQAVQQWFDEHFAGELTLVNAVTTKAEKLPSSIAIEAVWRGASPHLIVRGQKYALGSTLDAGWTIDGIEEDRVLLKRDGRVVAVRY